MKLLFITVITDGAADCENKEQVSIVLRLVDVYCNMWNYLIGILYCRWGLWRDNRSKLLLDKLIKVILNVKLGMLIKCREQGLMGRGPLRVI